MKNEVYIFVLFLFLQMTKHYELINYSEHGTLVDSVVYTTDYSDRKTPRLDAKIPEKNPLAKTIREVIDKRRGLKRNSEGEDVPPSKMISKEHQVGDLYIVCSFRALIMFLDFLKLWNIFFFKKINFFFR